MKVLMHQAPRRLAKPATVIVAAGFLIALRSAPAARESDPSVFIRTSVSQDGETGEYVYRYSVVNSSGAAASATIVKFPSPPTGGVMGPQGQWKLDMLMFTGLIVHPPDYDAVAAAGPARSLETLEVRSDLLPGVGQADAFPLAELNDWAASAPTATAVPHIAPRIGPATPRPEAAAVSVLLQIRDQIIAALTADHDPAADRLNAALILSIAAIQRHDLAAAGRQMRTLREPPTASAPPWRSELRHAMQMDVDYVIDTLRRRDLLNPREISHDPYFPATEWTYPGAMIHAPVDLAQFFRQTKAAFVGTVQRVSPEFIDDRIGTRTKVVLRPTLLIYGERLPVWPTGTVDVWVRGGSSWQRDSGWEGRSRAELVSHIETGATCFVAAMNITASGSPLDNQLWVKEADTLAVIDKGEVTPAAAQSTWVGNVVKQGRALLAPNESHDDAEAFLAALRRAAAPTLQPKRDQS